MPWTVTSWLVNYVPVRWKGEGIYVPKVDVLEMRSLIRMRSLIVKDSTRAKNRIKSLLRFHGVEIPEEFTRCSIGLLVQTLPFLATGS